jgi:hypothetical protein
VSTENGPFDTGDEVIDPGFLKVLDAIPPVKAAFDKLRLGTPIIGSAEYDDRRLPHGDFPGTTANGRLSIALDHLLMWYRVIREARFMPVWGHLTLLRPTFEASVQARWLLDLKADPETRVRRGIGVLVADLEELRKVEDEMTLMGWAPTGSYVRAGARIAARLALAAAESQEPIGVLDTVSLLRRFPQVGGHSDVIAYRVTSGVVHANVLATLMSEMDRIDGGVTVSTHRLTASQSLASGFTAAAVAHVRAAVQGLETYMEPPEVGSPTVATQTPIAAATSGQVRSVSPSSRRR